MENVRKVTNCYVIYYYVSLNKLQKKKRKQKKKKNCCKSDFKQENVLRTYI